jgi:hypothetical protein
MRNYDPIKYREYWKRRGAARNARKRAKYAADAEYRHQTKLRHIAWQTRVRPYTLADLKTMDARFCLMMRKALKP